MVRIKNRYLLVHVLCPSPKIPDNPSTTKRSADGEPAQLPPTVLFHPPLPPNITASFLAHAIKAQLADLYGDYGVGLTALGFSSSYSLILPICGFIFADSRLLYSTLLLPGDRNLHPSSCESPLSPRLGCAIVHVEPAGPRGRAERLHYAGCEGQWNN